ncbi:MAG: two-component system phosphate regulon sensor histidine kinase PhoR [Cryomorphaceae bacterium]|jgi:two-component system phosphate regulon sensor histidine kinase PhoR
MTGRSPFRVAILTALSLALSITVLLVGTLLLFREEIDLVQVLVFAALVFLSSWLIIYKSLQRFIYDKIKLIFRNMHSLKVGRSAFRLDMSKDVLGDVNKEVVDWAQDRMAEIEDLREKENFRKEFVGNLAHELKTPIFSIQGYILTLLEGALEDPNFNRKFLMKAAKSVDRMTMLVEDLDTITQFESGSLKLDKEKIDIVELTKEVIEQREEEAKQKNIDIRFNKPYDKPIYVGADSFRVSQVLINLITNSINYGKIGGKTTVRFFDMDERILIEVEDNGPGIDKEHIPRLFERFYRVDKSRSRHQGGTGLGLAICKHIIEGHEQSMNVRSEVGKGSVFSFTLAKS